MEFKTQACESNERYTKMMSYDFLFVSVKSEIVRILCSISVFCMLQMNITPLKCHLLGDIFIANCLSCRFLVLDILKLQRADNRKSHQDLFSVFHDLNRSARCKSMFHECERVCMKYADQSNVHSSNTFVYISTTRQYEINEYQSLTQSGQKLGGYFSFCANVDSSERIGIKHEQLN